MCAVKLSSSQEAEVNACWNTVYRRIFNYRKYDSVSTIICGLGRLDSKHLHTLWTLKFIKKCCFSQNVVVRCLGKLFTISGEFKQRCGRFDVDASSCFSHISSFVVLLMNILLYMPIAINAPFILFCMIMLYFYNTLLFACNLSVRCDE